jgi:hypothetical protein
VFCRTFSVYPYKVVRKENLQAMNEHIKSTAKRLIFSLLLVSALGGCATYASAPYGQSYGQSYGPAPISLGIGVYQRDYGYRNGPRFHGRSHGYRGARHQGYRNHGGGRGHQGRGHRGHRR